MKKERELKPVLWNADRGGVSNLRETLTDALQSYTVRVTVVLVALGTVPCYLLSMVTATLKN